MGFLELRMLFELLCDHLESGEHCRQLHFEGGYGLELPQGVWMIFVFSEAVFMCRFLTAPSSFFVEEQEASGAPLTADECLDMRSELESCEGGFAELFH